MKSLREKLVLITVLLQLCLSVLEVNAGGGGGRGGGGGGPVGELVQNENQLQFGDLLVFPMDGMNHYAVYVGGAGFPGNIFHMAKPGGCQFDTVRSTFRRHNYLDPGIAPEDQALQPQNRNVMIQTIRDLMNRPQCRKYRLLTRNCEQIATKVRYGEAHCNQLGTKVEPLARILRRPNIKRREASAAA